MFKSLAGRLRHVRIAVFHFLFPHLALERAVNRTREHEIELCLLPVLADRNRASIDVGANVGLYTHALQRLTTHVFAIEPHPRLARIVASMPASAVTVIRAIASRENAGDREIEVDLVEGIEADALARVADGPPAQGVRRIAAPAIALDRFAEKDIGFVKIDVEGHELAVLEGCSELIARNRPVFLVEAEARHRAGAPDDVFDFFQERGYSGWFVRQGTLHPVADFDVSLQDENRISGYTRRDQADYVNNFIFLPETQDTAAILTGCERILANAAHRPPTE